MVSNIIKTECCGTTCNKTDLVDKVSALESEIIELELKIAEYEKQREEFARNCFIAGRESEDTRFSQFDEKQWLNFKATEL